MATTLDSAGCCVPQVTNVPGVQGDPGVDGTNGINAFTLTTNEVVLPAVGASVTAQVANSEWMVVGQILVADGPAHFRVISKPDLGSVELEFLGLAGDLAEGETVVIDANVSPAGVQGVQQLSNISVLAVGTAATVGTTAGGSLLDFGSVDPSVTLPSGGKWLLLARVRYDFVGWQSTARTITTKLKVSAPTPADVPGATTDLILPIIAAPVSHTAGIVTVPPVVYTAATASDTIQLWAVRSGATPTAGSITAVEANITAIKIADV